MGCGIHQKPVFRKVEVIWYSGVEGGKDSREGLAVERLGVDLSFCRFMTILKSPPTICRGVEVCNNHANNYAKNKWLWELGAYTFITMRSREPSFI